MSALNEMTIKQLVETHNAIEGVEPIVAWKGRKDLLEKLNKGIQAVKASGLDKKLVQKWMGTTN